MSLQQYYCTRCGINFDSFSAKLQHIQNSQFHHFCHVCVPPLEFEKLVELDEHLGAEHNICISCDIQFDRPDELVQHDMKEHHICVACRQFFDSLSSLTDVSSISCYPK